MRSLICKQAKQQGANKTKRNPKIYEKGTVIGKKSTDKKTERRSNFETAVQIKSF